MFGCYRIVPSAQCDLSKLITCIFFCSSSSSCRWCCFKVERSKRSLPYFRFSFWNWVPFVCFFFRVLLLLLYFDLFRMFANVGFGWNSMVWNECTWLWWSRWLRLRESYPCLRTRGGRFFFVALALDMYRNMYLGIIHSSGWEHERSVRSRVPSIEREGALEKCLAILIEMGWVQRTHLKRREKSVQANERMTHTQQETTTKKNKRKENEKRPQHGYMRSGERERERE